MIVYIHCHIKNYIKTNIFKKNYNVLLKKTEIIRVNTKEV